MEAPHATSYTYDAAYNRTGEITVDVGSVTLNDLTYGYNNRQQLTTVTNNLDASQHVSYTFDANGNQTSKTKASVTSTFIYRGKVPVICSGTA